jgi:hypothetical protein
MLLFFSDLEISEKMWNCLFEEIFIRQMFWMFHSSEYENKMKAIIFDAIECKNVNYEIENEKKNLNSNSNSKNLNNKKNGIENDIINLKDNFQYCDNKGLLEDIIKDLSKDENIIKIYNENKKENNIKENIKNFTKNELEKNFKEFIDKSTTNLKEKITNLIVTKRGLSFLLNDINNNKKKKHKNKKNEEQKIEIYDKPEQYDPNDYNKFKVENLLSKIKKKYSKKLLKFAYSSQKGNHLLLITFIAKNKMEDEVFIKELKENYGVYINVNSFIQEMKNKLDTINSYSDLYKFIGCNLLDNKSELEYLSESYKKAKEKQYIRINTNNNFNYSNSGYLRSSNNSLFSRGRGRFRRGIERCNICGQVH